MKATLRKEETGNCIATSPSGNKDIIVTQGVKYDFLYDSEDNFYLVVDDVLYCEVSTAFDFVD